MFSRVLPRESVRISTEEEEEARTAPDHRSSVIRFLSTVFYNHPILIKMLFRVTKEAGQVE